MKNPQTINDQYYYDTWYEIFVIKENEETQTINTCETEDEAIGIRDNYLEKLSNGLLSNEIVNIEYNRWGSLDDKGWNIIQID